jgi:hypothetical protein
MTNTVIYSNTPLSLLHCSRIRKVWHQDFPETRTVQGQNAQPSGAIGSNIPRGNPPRGFDNHDDPSESAGRRPPVARNAMARMYANNEPDRRRGQAPFAQDEDTRDGGRDQRRYDDRGDDRRR